MSEEVLKVELPCETCGWAQKKGVSDTKPVWICWQKGSKIIEQPITECEDFTFSCIRTCEKVKIVESIFQNSPIELTLVQLRCELKKIKNK